MRTLHYMLISVCILCGVCISSCDVHEFPEPKPMSVEFTLSLNYDTNLPLYKVVEYSDETRGAFLEKYDLRYIVKVYDADAEGAASREELYSYEFVKDDVTELNTDIVLNILPGNYAFRVWTDYISADEDGDLYYNTESFAQLALLGDEHDGSNDMRDAFSGMVESEVSSSVTKAYVDMRRPMAKFSFVTTDIDEFMARVLAVDAAEASSRAVNLDDYYVVLRYHGFMPSSFNMFSDKPNDSRVGVSFQSSIRNMGDGEAELGFDYVFANVDEAVIAVSVELYDSTDKLLSASKAVDIPIVRSKLTVVRGRFLTEDASGGVAIDPGYDGEYNYRID